MLRKSILITALLNLLLAAPPAAAQVDQAVSDAEVWFATHQNTDGSFGTTPELTPRDSALSVLALLGGDPTSSALANGLVYVSNVPEESTHFRSLRIQALARAGRSSSQLLDSLFGFRNGQGFGAFSAHETNLFDTALAVQALATDEANRVLDILPLLDYLRTSQNPDGGWGFLDDDPSLTYYTAEVLLALVSLEELSVAPQVLNTATNYLLARQLPNGSFGSVLETALVYRALLARGYDVSTLQVSPVSFLLAQQLPNGSWENDHFTTAQAVLALRTQLPNLTVAALTANPSNAPLGTPVTLTATVRNTGPVSAPASELVVRARTVDGEERASAEVGALAPGAQSNVNVTVPTTGDTGSLVLFAIADGRAEVAELDESDNARSVSVGLRTKADLAVFSSSLAVSPSRPEPDTNFTLQITTQNLGETQAPIFSYQVFELEAGEPVRELASGTAGPIDPGKGVLISKTLNLPAGEHILQVVLDAGDTVDEESEDNNEAEIAFFVVESTQPDLAIATADLTVTPAQPAAGQSATASATVRNLGTKAGSALAELFDGDPTKGGILIGSQTVNLQPGASVVVSQSFTAGEQSVVVVALVDRAGALAELDEANNAARRYLRDLPDLAVGFDNFDLSPAEPEDGDPVQGLVTVRNAGTLEATNVQVEVFDGEPGAGGTPVFADRIASIPAGGNRSVSFTWTAAGGLRNLVAVVDRGAEILEQLEDNNRVDREIAVPRATGPDLAVSSVDTTGLTHSAVTLSAQGTVQVAVTNSGDDTGETFAVRLFEDRDGSGRFSTGDQDLGSATVAGLASGATATVSIAVDAGFELYRPLIWAEADASNVVAERREDNNRSALFGDCETLPPAAIEPVEEEWFVPGIEAETAPVVVQLSDDNGDGRIDSRDNPDVVFHTQDAQGSLVLALSGLDGSRLWAFRSSAANPLQNRLAHLAAADLDGDGVVEIVAVQSNNRLVALDRAGRVRWVSDPIESTGGDWAGSVEIGDLTGDGVPEIVVGRSVLSNTGRRIAFGTANVGRNRNYYGPFGVPYFFDQPHSIIADVDLDGTAEIVAGDALYRLVNGTLTVVWDKVFPDKLMEDGFAAVGNLDADPQAEIVYVSSNQIMVLNHDGSVRSASRVMIPFSNFYRPTYWGGPPTIADITGDGTPEILVAGDTQLIAYNSGLGTLWRKGIEDIAAVTSVTAFDLDGDGKREVIYLDENYLYILNGANGATLHQRPNTSKTGSEYPVVADIDNDGSAEILVPSNRHRNGDTSTQGLHALGNPSWRGTRPMWNQYSYHVTNVQLDGTVPASETPAWQASNTWRVNLQMPRRPRRLPNLTVGLPRVGPAGSSGVPVTLRVGNGGRETVPAGARIRLYTADPAGSGASPAGEGATAVALSPGAWQDVELFWQASGEAPRTAFAQVDPDADIEECGETDNVLAFELTETVLPDLAIPAGGVTVPAGPIAAGQLVTVSVQVRNAGAAASPASSVRLFDGDPAGGVVVGEAPVAALTPGQTSTVTVAWDTLGLSGAHVLHAVVDAGAAVAESDETNNEGLVSVALTAPTLPDLAAETLQTSSSEVSAGEPVQLTVRVKNRGLALAGGFEVAFRVNSAEEGRVSSPAELGTGESRDVTWTLSTLGRSGVFALQAAADPSNKVSEQNETNNVAAASLRVNAATLSLSLKTEQLTYQVNQDVRFQLTATNAGTAAQGATLRVRVVDAAGVELAVVANQEVTLAPGSTPFTFTWNTGAALPGPYAGIAELIVAGAVPARATASFVVARERDLGVRLFTDRGAYTPGQEAILTGSVANDSANEILENLRARFAVLNPAGAEVFSSERLVPLLLPGSATSLTVRWAVGTASPGSYTASLSVRDATGFLIGFGGAPFQVDDSAQSGSGLRGHLAVAPAQVGIGAPVVLRFEVTNAGNAPLLDLPFRFDVTRLTDGVVAKSLSVVSSLDLGETARNAVVLPTAELAEGEYLVVMTALPPGGPVHLDSAALSAVRAISVGDIRVPEGDSGTALATFEAVLSSPSEQPVTVHFATADATATAGSDYTASSGTVSFAPGETRAQITVPVHGDTAPEADEVFLLTLSSPDGAILGVGQAVAILVDEEGCSSPNLLANAGAEEGTLETDLPGWTAAAGGWTRRIADPTPIDGVASFAAMAGGTVELVQEVDLAPFAEPIDAQGLTFALEGFLRTSPGTDPARGRVIVEYRDAAGANVLASYDSGELESPDAWRAVSDSRAVPAGTRRARVRLLASSGETGEVFFDRLGLRSLGIPVLTAEDAQVAEGNTGTTALQFRARMSCAGPSGVTANTATAAGTATAGTDYDTTTGTLTFTPGALDQTVDVAIHGDTTDEQDETLRMVFTGGTDVVVLTPEVTGTILDDDGPVTVSIGDATVTEGDSGTVDATFTVTLSDESGQEVRVQYATANGTAAAGADFVSASGTVEFPPGITSRTVTVQVKGDLLDEPAESFLVRLSSPLHATIGDGEGEGQIQDNDEVLIAVTDVRLTEGDSGTKPATFTVTLSLPSVLPVTVQYATADGTALAPGDYAAASGTLTFAPGTTSQTVAVPVVGELVKEPEEVFFLRLANPTNASLGRPEGAGAIVDNDGVLVSVGDLVVKEGDTNVTAAFKITLSKSFNQPIAVQYETQDGTALTGADYTATSGTVTFPAGTTLQTINVAVLPDTLEEPVESFSLRVLTANNGAVIFKPVGVATLTDNDAWVLNGPLVSSERVPGCLSLSPPGPVFSGYNDTSAWRRTKVNLGTSFDQTYRVLLGGAGGMVYMLQNVGINAIGAGSGGLGNTGIVPAMGLEMDIVSNGYIPDPPYDHLAIDLNGSQQHNGAPPVQASKTSTNIDDGLEHALRVVWNASAKAFTAYFDGDERLVFERDLVQTIFGGTSSVYYGMTSGTYDSLNYFCPTRECFGSTNSPSVSVGNARVLEGASGTKTLWFPVTLSCPTDHIVSVSYATLDRSAIAGEDYLPISGTLVFQPGEVAHDLAVTILGDGKFEADEELELRLADPAGGELRYAEGTATILDQDSSMILPYTRLAEGNTGGWITTPYFLRLSRPLNVPVSFNWTLANGTATTGSDYQAKSGTVTFPPGDTMQEIQIAVFGDATPEPDETIVVNLSNRSAAFLPASLILTIVDDEECLGGNLIRNGGADEPLVNGQIPGWTTVVGSWGVYPYYPHQGPYYFWAGNNAVSELMQDVNLSGFAPQVAAGRMRVQFEAFMHSHAPEEPLDTPRFILEFRNASKSQVLGSFDSTELETRGEYRRFADIFQVPVGTAWVRIRLISTRYTCCDNNAHFDTLSLRSYGIPDVRVEDISIPEGSSGVRTTSFPVRLQCAVPYPVRVDYVTADGTAKAGSDYQSAFGTLTFAAGEVQKLVAVPVLGDTVSEGNETFFLNLVSVDAGVSRPQGVGTILEDEVSITIGDVSVVESNSGFVAANFPVTLSGAIDQTVTVDYETEASSATAGDDFLPIAGTLIFNPGETSKTLRVDVLADTTTEPDEKLKMNLRNPVNATIMRGQATATIVTDDLGLTISDAAVIEGNSGTVNAIFTVDLGAASSSTVTVAYSTRADSATAGTDFTTNSGTLSFAAGQTSKTITISVKGDTQQETGETFFVDLSSPVNASILDGEGLGLIGDDDGCPGPNLLANPSGEEPLVGGEIPGWTEVSGFAWTYSNFQGAYAGANFLYAGATVAAELRQDVDLTPYAAFIDAGIQRFSFEGYVRSAAESPSDPARVVLEYLDANRVLLRAFDSGEITSVGSWSQVADLQPAPAGTRWARVRLITRRISPGNDDAYFDGFSLRSLDTPVAQVADISIYEGDLEAVNGRFTIGLTCAGTRPIDLSYATADGTATSPNDYAADTGVLHFEIGEVSKEVEVPVVGDYLNEIRETFFLRLSSPSNVVVLDPEALATIRDADPGAPPVAGTTYVYTRDADFDLGSLVSVHHDVPTSDQLQISEEGSTFPFLWVAASARGTIVKIETRTGEILGEYSTNPDNHGNSDPSRTTVALDGSVWVGNRAERTIAHIGLPELNQCVDRNGNGAIDTSSAYGDVLPWPNAGSVDSAGGVRTAQDECILHYVQISSTGARHLSLTADGNLWASGTGNRIFNLVDTKTGQILRTETGFGCGGYGGLTDRNGIIWSTTWGSLLRWDPKVSPPTAESRRCLPVPGAYGLAIDSSGWIWASSLDWNAVWKVSPDGNTILGPYGHGSWNAQGLAVDGKDHVWVSSALFGGTTVGHLKNDGSFVGNVTGVLTGSTGVAVDSDGKIWTANYNSSTAARIDPEAGPLGTDGVTRVGAVDLMVQMPGSIPYNYSDMTGFSALRNTVRQGLWTVIQDGGKAGAEWGTVTWNTEPQASVPAGSSIVVEARAADTVPGLGTKPYQALGNGVPFALDGRYLQVRVTLKASPTNESPILADLHIDGVQDGELSVGDVTITEGDTGTVSAAFQISLAAPVAREVRVSYASEDGTALAGTDYTPVSGTAVFPPGVTTQTVSVPLVGDTVPEPDETFTLRLSVPVRALLVRAEGIGTILDNDRVPVLAATKTDNLVDADSDGAVSPGDELRYEVTIRNTGTKAATAVAFSDSIPQNTSVVSGKISTSQGTVESENPVRVAIGDIAPNGSVTVSFHVTIAEPLPAGVSEVNNQGTVESEELPDLATDDPDTPEAGDPTVTPVASAPELAAEKVDTLIDDADGNGVPSPGDTVRYEITIRNTGSGRATHVVLSDPIPEHTSLVAGSVSTSQGTVEGESPVTVAIGEIAANSSATVSFDIVIANPIATGVKEIRNQGAVTSDQLPAVLTDDPAVDGSSDPTVTSITASPRLVASKTATLVVDADSNGVPSPGDHLEYQVTLVNNGNTSATDVIFEDALPAHTTVVAGSVETSQGTMEGEDPVRVAVGELPAGDSVTIRFRVEIDSPIAAGVRQVSNQGAVTSAELPAVLTDDPAVSGEADPTVTAITAAPVLTAEKTDVLFADQGGDGAASPGDVVLYQIVLTNRGNTAATSVVFHDAVPASTAIEAGSVQTSQGTVDSEAPVQVTVGEIAASASVTISFRVRIDDPFPVDRTAVSNQGRVASAELAEQPTDDPETPQAGDPTLTPVFIVPEISVGDVSVVESGGSTAFPVTLSRVSNRDVTLTYATADGSATAGADYNVASGTLTIPAGSTSAAIAVEVLDDLIDEPDETLTLRLSDSTGGEFADANATGTILDDDVASLSIEDVTVAEGDSGTTDAVFTVRLSTPSYREIRVDYTTSAGTATEGTDYHAASGTLTFAAGETERSLAVPVVGDVVLEADETFEVALSSPVEATIADGEGLGTITNDELCQGPNLLANPGAEARPVNGEIPGWTEVDGAEWQRRTGPPAPFEGSYFFWSLAQLGELRQDVDVSAFADRIAAGAQRFAFSARVRSLGEVPPDTARVLVEYRDATNTLVLEAFDSGEVASVAEWLQLADVRTAPAGTGWIRVRLLSNRFTQVGSDGYFDALSLISLGTATVSVDDVSVYEGDSGLRDAVFTLRLSCVFAKEVKVGYTTADGLIPEGAKAGEDYVTTTGMVTIPVGSTTAKVPVPVVGDTVDEPNETFFLDLDLLGPAEAVLLDEEGTGVILNDDFCQRSPGYWKNHREVWPVDELQLGGVWYSDAQILAFLSYNGSDATTRLAHHLSATKLNLARGSDPEPILSVVMQADAFLAANPPGSDPKEALRDQANALKDALDAYNNACPSH